MLAEVAMMIVALALTEGEQAVVTATYVSGILVAFATSLIAVVSLFVAKRQMQVQLDSELREARAETNRLIANINAEMASIPPEFPNNLRYHYCKLKNSGRLATFIPQLQTTPALRLQVDTIEQTFNRVASLVLSEPLAYKDFRLTHAIDFVRTWMLCFDDIMEKRRGAPYAGERFETLAIRLMADMQESELPKIDCSDVTERV